MTANISNISKYQQTNQVWQQSQAEKNAAKKVDNSSAKTTGEVGKADGQGGTGSDVKVTEWKPIKMSSPLVPTVKEGYGTVIGDVNLSEGAQKYYEQLKNKYSGMDFILVSKDMKSQVAANASAYGNALKPVVLIDDEKLERMANDESFRKKYEGLIAMAQMKLQDAKSSLASSGASVKNFGLSVNEDGSMSFFATVEKANEAQAKRLEKRQEAKKEEKLKEKRKEAKKAREEAVEKLREKNKADKVGDTDKENPANDVNKAKNEKKEYVEFRSNDIDALLKQVSSYAYNNSLNSVVTEAESQLGRNIDFRG